MTTPEVAHNAFSKYDEADCSLSFKTEDGVRAIVPYTRVGGREFEIYPYGDKRYGTIAAYVFLWEDLGQRPEFSYVGGLKDLTKNPS